MIEVTALIDGTGSSPQWALQFRRASATGSKSGIRKPDSLGECADASARSRGPPGRRSRARGRARRPSRPRRPRPRGRPSRATPIRRSRVAIGSERPIAASRTPASSCCGDLRQVAADHDRARVEEVDALGQHLADGAPRPADGLQCDRLARARVRDDVADRARGQPGGREVRCQRVPTHDRLEAADVPAGAERRRRARPAGYGRCHPPRRAPRGARRARTRSRTRCSCRRSRTAGDRRHASASSARRAPSALTWLSTSTGAAERDANHSGIEKPSQPGIIRGSTGSPRPIATGAWTATPIPRVRAGGVPASAQKLSESARGSRSTPFPAAVRRVEAERATPPAASLRGRRPLHGNGVASRSAIRTIPALGLNVRVAGGRPPVEATPVASSNRSRASSDWTRSASVERESPLCSANSVACRGRSIANEPQHAAGAGRAFEHVHELTRLRLVQPTEVQH